MLKTANAVLILAAEPAEDTFSQTLLFLINVFLGFGVKMMDDGRKERKKSAN